MLSETFDDLDPWHAFIGEEIDDIALFNSYDFDPFCPTNPLFLTKFARDRFRPLSFLRTQTVDALIICLSHIS
jgi:hypothetical protein